MIITSRSPFSGAVVVNSRAGFGSTNFWLDSSRDSYIKSAYNDFWGVAVPKDIFTRIENTKWRNSASLDKEIQDPKNAPNTSAFFQRASDVEASAKATQDAQTAQAQAQLQTFPPPVYTPAGSSFFSDLPSWAMPAAGIGALALVAFLFLGKKGKKS